LRQENRQIPAISINEFVPDHEEDFTYETLLGNDEDMHAEIVTEEIMKELKKFPLLNEYVTGEKTQKELADQLGRSKNSIYRQIRREREQLKRRLKKLGLLG